MAKKTVADSLKTLGVTFGATWEEINQSYKDLIRVWHPDRFANDERLKKKAEDSSRELNLAMQTLRKEYDPNSKKPQNSEKAHEVRKDWFEQTQPKNTQQRTLRPDFRFTIRPLMVYEKWMVSLARVTLALMIGTLGAYFLQDLRKADYTTVLGGALTLVGINSTIKHSLLLLIQRPIITVDARGIRCLFSTPLSWRDVSRVWSLTASGQSALAIEYSSHYLERQSSLRKFFLKTKYLMRQAHLVLSCSGLDHHPNDVVRAIEAQHATGAMKMPLIQNTNQPRSFLWCQIISAACAVSILLRCIFNLETSVVELSVYILIFALCQGYVMTSRLMSGDKAAERGG